MEWTVKGRGVFLYDGACDTKGIEYVAFKVRLREVSESPWSHVYCS